jgi:pimeloyl-ACP methyl ester carboxylesterase
MMLFIVAMPRAAQVPKLEVRNVRVREGVQLSFVESGQGVPVIFIHGTLGDYATWEGQLAPFARAYRVFSYSRRYNYPNTNLLQPHYSAIVDADDLAVFIEKLHLGKAHLIGHSYGAYAALILALKHPDLVRSMTLAEPPVLFTGEHVDKAKQQVLAAIRTAFEKGDAESAVRTIMDASQPGQYDTIPKEYRPILLRNAMELKALALSDEMYPPVDREAVRQLRIPTLLLSGENSPAALKSSDAELEQLLPERLRKRAILAGADHAMWFEQPDKCRTIVLDFLRSR